MRILGKVSVSAQCIYDGVSSGAFQIKAKVVLDLAKNLDAECVSGSKIAAQLNGESPPSAPSTPRATPPPGKGAPLPAPSVPAAETPRTPPPRWSLPSPRSPRSPPGFPTPRYPASPGTTAAATIPVLRVTADGHQVSPRSANIRALTAETSFSVCTNRDQYAKYGHHYEYPSNCGFNRQWYLPDKFKPCGPRCQGGFCSCLINYRNQGSGDGRRETRR